MPVITPPHGRVPHISPRKAAEPLSQREKHLILPVETAARELDAKLLLSLHAARRGIVTTIGAKALVNLAIHRLTPGVFLPPNFHPSSDKMIGIARQLGHRVVAWDEEGLVWLSSENYRMRRASRASLAGLDTVFTWGEQHAQALKPALDGLPARVVLAGNPRVDLLRPEFRALYAERARELVDEFGDFILINSNFGWVNHLLGHGATADGGRDLEAVAAKSAFPIDYLRHRLALYGRMTEALTAMARRFPDRRIVVRPHPDESDAGWRKAAEGLDNVTVRYSSELLPWLLAAGHIVQNGCTTAIEAALLGRIAISYRPVVVAKHEIPQPALAALDAHDLDELLAMVATPGLTDRPPPEKRGALKSMIASVDGPSSCERVIEEIDALLERGRPGASPLRRLVGQASALRRRIKKRRASGDPGSTSNPAYYSHKFPPVGADEVAAKLGAFARVLSMDAPRVQEMSDRVFRISPA